MSQISGLVVTLAPDEHTAGRALEELRARPELHFDCATWDGTSGDGAGAPDRVAVVLEAESAHESEAWMRAIGRTPGVERVEVVFVGFVPEPAATQHLACTPEERDVVGSA